MYTSKILLTFLYCFWYCWIYMLKLALCWFFAGGRVVYHLCAGGRVNSSLRTVMGWVGRGRGCDQSPNDGCDRANYHGGSGGNNGNIFVDPHLEGQQKDMASRGAAKGEKVEPEATMTDEVITNRGQEGEAQVEEGLPKEHLASLAMEGPSSFPNIPHIENFIMSRHYFGLLSYRASQSPTEILAPDRLSWGKYSFFEGLDPYARWYGAIVEGHIF